ncbi:sarcosine oxidase subunit gamma [Thalassospira xiamenensis]|uniref:Sarcosine oxidase subunit gamma n=1 Tax=Thalassospira xiamenensis TaxID=220697 RepID=A0A285TW35_9PROT|nr:sarcosine oxidase subunit gamma [Thalassospira xiamenensis]SOC28553.1 sarcosine oxidase subunit gamma [Thalassospira xiamenensis]
MTAHIDLSKAGILAESSAVRVALLPPVARFSLRAATPEQKALSKALGAPLPAKIGQCGRKGDIEIICLGPDEWTIIAPEDQAGTINDACAAIYAKTPHSLTEISDREVTVRITGPKASDLITIGCPRDLDQLPTGEARRTVFDGVTTVLWRDGEQNYRLDLWRSFAPHVIALLETGCAELAGE